MGNLAGFDAVEAFFFEGMSQFLDLELSAMDKRKKDDDKNTKFQMQMVRALGCLHEPKHTEAASLCWLFVDGALTAYQLAVTCLSILENKHDPLRHLDQAIDGANG